MSAKNKLVCVSADQQSSNRPTINEKQVRVHFRCVPGLPAGRASSESKLVRHSDVPRGLPASSASSEIKLVRHPDASRGLTASRASSEIKLVRHPDASRGLPANHSSSEIKLIAFPMTFLPLPGFLRHRDQKNCRNRCASCQIQGINVIGNSLFLKFADQHPQVPAK